MEISEDMKLLSELLKCADNICLWCYDGDGVLEWSNCPDEKMLDTAFGLFDCKRQVILHAAENDKPVSVGTAFGLRWSAVFKKENGALENIWVIGPFFYHDISERSVRQGLHCYSRLETSAAWRMRFPEVLRGMPTVQNSLICRYIIMLQYCVTGERIEFGDIDYPQVETMEVSAEETAQEDRKDRHKTWQAEQSLLQMVRNGDLDYSKALTKSMSLSSGVPVQGDDALRQAKTSVMVFTTLVTRAAIEGGLSPEEAYALGDGYMQSAESARTYSEIDMLSNTMYADFIGRVHKRRLGPDYSAEIRRCIDHIELNLDRNIRAAELADLVGYSEYYLTAKFKEETGVSVAEYAKNAKVERAKVLLTTTDLSMQEIADELGFCSRNYFTHSFKEVTGVTPTRYREMG